MIIGYAPCIEHGYDIADGLGINHMNMAIETGYWQLYRFDPRRVGTGKPPLHLDSKKASRPLTDYLATENRFAVIKKKHPERFQELVTQAEQDLARRRAVYEKMAEMGLNTPESLVAGP